MKSTAKKSIQLVASAAVSLTWAGVSLAQTWNLNANGNWGIAPNWSPASVPNGIGASASLLNIITAPRTVSLNVPVTLGNLTFGGNFAYTIGGTNTLTFDVAAGNAALNVSGTASHSISRPIVLNDTLVINQDSSGILTLSGARSGTGGLIKNGIGQVTLSGVGSFTGQTQINNGTILYNTAGAIPAASLVTIGDGVGAAGSAVLNLNAAMSAAQALNVTLASDGVLIQNNNQLVRLSAVSGTGELRLNSALGNGFEITGTGGNTTFGGAVTGGIAANSANPATGSRFTKTGASTLTLSGNNTYVARTFINGGSLRAGSNTALGAASAGFDNATFVYTTGSLQLSNNITLAERIYLNGTGGGSGALRNFSGNNTIISNVTLGWTATGVASAVASIGADAGSTLTISGNIDGAQSLTKVGTGVLVLSGNNTWSGATIVSAGTLRLGAATGMATTVLTVNGGTFDLNGFSKTVNTLSGTGGTIALGSGALSVNQLAAGTYAGVIAGTGSLAKTGAGTLTLSGANTYTGGTTVSAGTLQGNTTSLQGNIVNNAIVAFNQTAAGTYAGAMSGAGRLTKSGAGTLTLTGANNYTGGTTVTAGTLQGNTTSLQGNIAASGSAVIFDQAVAGTYAGVMSGNASLTKTGAGTLTLTGANSYSGGTRLNGGTVAVASDARLGTGGLTFNGGALQTLAALTSAKAVSLVGAGTIDTNGFTSTFSGAITGAGSLAKTGAGTLLLTGANTFTGGTTVNAGTLQGNTTSLRNTIVNNAAVTFNQTAAGTYAGVMSGTGSLTKIGAGTLTLSGANTYSGGTSVNAGILSGNSISLQGNIINSATVNFNQTLAGTYTGSISGTGVLTKSGAGTLILTGANTYTGGTTVSAGTLQGSTTSLRGNIVANNSAVTFDQAAAGTYAGTMSGNGSLTKMGAGTLTLTGANSYTGGTGLNGGSIAVANDAQLGTGTLTFNGGALQTLAAFNSTKAISLLGAGTIDTNGFAANLSGAITGVGSLVKNGTGTLTVTGANTYTGGTTVTAGTLQGNAGSLQGNILNNASVVFDQAAAGTYASVLSGTGSLTKTGAGTLTLTGTNTYAGGTNLNAGTVAVASDAQLGTGNLRFNGGALQTTAAFNSSKTVSLLGAGTIDTNGFTANLSGVISGAGSLVKNGAGVLTLTGVNTYTGGTTVNAGALQGDSTSLQSAIVNNASVVFDQAATGTYAGVMSGTGSLTKNNGGTLILTGANTYAGGTTVSAGTLQGSSTTLQGNIANNAAVAFDQAGAGTYAGAMSGTGSLTKNNTGTLVLTGANTYSGGTTVNGGTLQGSTASLQGDIVNNASVVFDQNTDGAYAAAMSGTGALTKLGAGNLTLEGVNTFSGPTAVNAGTITVLGSMTSNLSLASGTTLTGNGTVGGISAAAGSIVAPGSAQSTLTANGAYNHSDGAIFRVHADASGAASRLNVNGTATLAGGTVDVQAEDGNYAAATRYTILNASGVGGMFSSVTSSLAFLTPTLEYDPTNVFLTLARNNTDFATVALTPNQRQVSNALDQATAANATGDITTVIDAVTGLSAPQARSAYESMGGLIHTLLPTIGIPDAIQFSRATASRLRARTDGTTGTGLAWSGIQLASAPAPKSDAPALFASSSATRTASDPVSGNVWLSGYGLDGDLEGDASSGAYDYRISGLIIGVDTDVDRHWTGGLSAAFSDWRVRNDGRGDRSDAQAYRIAAYGRFTDGPIRVDGVVGFGNVNYETDRRIVFGTIDRTAHADYSGDQFTANVVGRYRIEQGSYGIEPFAALQYVLESQSDFVEAGADSINLAVASRTLKSTRGTLGARVDRGFETAGGKGLVEVRAGYSHEFSGVPRISATFVGDPARTALGIFAENFDRESWLVGAGVSFAPKKNLTLYLDVNGDFQSQGTLVSLMGGLRASW